MYNITNLTFDEVKKWFHIPYQLKCYKYSGKADFTIITTKSMFTFTVISHRQDTEELSDEVIGKQIDSANER